MDNFVQGTIYRVFTLLAVCALVCACEGSASTINPNANQPGAGTGGGYVAGASGAFGGNTYLPPGGGTGGTAGMVAGGAGATTGGAGAGTGGQAGTIAEPMDGGALDDGGSTIIDPAAGTGGTAGTAGSAGTAGTAGSAGTTPPPPGNLCLQQGNGDYASAGPYTTARKDVNLGGTLGPYTIFYPANMEANCPHPIVAWGNGTGVTGADTYGFYADNAASWGIVTIACHNSNAASQPFLASGLDYLLAENQNSASEFYQKLSTRAGTSGHSQGAMAATTATQHANVEALVQVQGGGNAKAGVAVLALTGTADTIVGTQMPTATYNGATGPACLANYQGADHISTPTLAGYISANAGTIQYMRLYAAWFRCFLADDPTACALFQGNPCPLATEPGWADVQTKNM